LCSEGARNYFYVVNETDVPCSNHYCLGKSNLLVSPVPVLGLSALAVTKAGDVNWLLRCPSTANVGITLEGGYSLLTFSPKEFSSAEDSALDCGKQEVSFKRAYMPGPEQPSPSKIRFSRSADKDAFVASVDEPDNRYMDLLSAISGATPLPGKSITIKTRYTGTASVREASDWIGDWFYAQQLETYTQTFNVPSRGTAYNVIGEKVGTTNPDEIIVIGAHHDSTSQQAATLAPGAIDNGSGAVGIMVLAAAAMNMEFGRTVHFITFGGEEQGLYGSSHYVSEAQKAKKKIVGAIIMDMIGYSSKYYGVKIEGTTNPDIQRLMKLFDTNVKTYTELTREQSTDSFGSDHVPFQKAGYPAFLAIEQDDTDYPAYHRTTDVVTNANKGQSVDILKGIAGTLFDLAF